MPGNTGRVQNPKTKGPGEAQALATAVPDQPQPKRHAPAPGPARAHGGGPNDPHGHRTNNTPRDTQGRQPIGRQPLGPWTGGAPVPPARHGGEGLSS